MGGRGSSGSGKIKGVTVNLGNGINLEYRLENNKVYLLNKHGIPEEQKFKSMNQVIEVSKKLGFEIVGKYTKKDLNKMEKAREADRKEVDKFLDNAYVKNKIAGQVNKSYRSHKQSIRISRRR